MTLRSRTALKWATTLFLLAAIATGGLFAQQITRVAVVDLARVLSSFPKDTAALKNFELKKAEIQAEADKRSAEIKGLQAQKLDADSRGDPESSRALEAEASRKTAALRDYVQARQNELDLLAKALSSTTSFLQKLNSMIARVAEEEGFSLVLNLKPQDQSASLVLWNSPAIDITDKVIQALSK
jgi:outer membrane protein